MLKIFFILTGVVFSLFLAPVFGQNHAESSFEQAVALLHKKEWKQAQLLLQEQLKAGKTSLPVLYNLGLTFYQLNKPAFARAYWLKALFNHPYNQQVRKGLKQVEDACPFWLKWPSDFVFAVQAFLLICLIILLYKKKFQAIVRFWLAPALCAQTLSVFYFYPRLQAQNYAILTQPAELYSDSSSSAPVLFKPKEGAFVKIKKTVKNNWSYIILSDTTRGWVLSKFLIPLK